MSFYIYDIIFLIIFGTILTTFLIKNKKKIQREGILILYRTQLGIKIINYIAKKYKKFLNSFEPVIIGFGYILTVVMLFMLGQLVYKFLQNPEFIKLAKIPPLMPLIPYISEIFKIDYLPPFYFTYWILVLGIAAVSHELMHGIFAKARGIKIKSTGFAFLGPFAGAFVEPDEEKVKKLKIREQLGFLSAGTFANLVMAVLFFVIIWLFFISVFVPSGVIFNTYSFTPLATKNINSISNETLALAIDSNLNLTKITANNKTYYIDKGSLNEEYIVAYDDMPALKNGLNGIIIGFDGKKIETNTELKEQLLSKKPGDEVIIKTLLDDKEKEYKLVLSKRPDNANQAYLGIMLVSTESSSILGKIKNKILFFKDPNTYYRPQILNELMIFIYNLLWWIILINFSVAAVNMLPLGIFDGGRTFYLTMLAITKSEKFAKIAYKFSTYFLLAVFLFLMLLWVKNFPL